jgi:hypothetical protein
MPRRDFSNATIDALLVADAVPGDAAILLKGGTE